MLVFSIKSRRIRLLLLAVEIAAFVGTGAWIVRHAVADTIAKDVAAKSLESSLRLDPSRHDLHLRLARAYQYSVAGLNQQAALEHLQRAAKLNPYSAQPWLEMAALFSLEGATREAAQCLLMADEMAPHLPSVHWPIGNFYLLQGNNMEAFRHFKKVLAGTSKYDGIAFRTAWKASSDGDMILAGLIPDKVSTQISYLHFLGVSKKFEDAKKVWRLILQNPESFPPLDLSEYLNILIAARRPADAYEVWDGLRQKGLIAATYQPSSQNLILNGDFERAPLNMGFDWRLVPYEEVRAMIDQRNFRSPSHAVMVQFPGNRNVEYEHVFQYVPVEPGRAYRLQAFAKTEGITTDRGPRLRVSDPYDSRLLNVSTEDLLGSTGTWVPLRLNFVTSPKTSLIMVAAARSQSQKLDSNISGKVWLDDVVLTPE